MTTFNINLVSSIAPSTGKLVAALRSAAFHHPPAGQLSNARALVF